MATFDPPEATVRQWVASFQAEPPLHTLFPLVLPNGKSIPGVHIVCSKCQERISGDRVHGRVIQSLAHVVTVDANGHCVRCNRLTNVRCRFRAEGQNVTVEWPDSAGQWHCADYRIPTRWERAARRWRAFWKGLDR